MRAGAVAISNLVRDRESGESEFAAAVVHGLSQKPKSLPSRFFYDARGSVLFEMITRLPEYYLTRTETAILDAHATEMVDGLPSHGVLVEFGSGSSLKTEILLAAAPAGMAYVPIDVSEAALADAGHRLVRRFPELDVRPIVGDFSRPIRFPADLVRRPKLGFFPGSTIGNLSPANAVELLSGFARSLGADSRLIVGVDLKKDVQQLVAAYNDRFGVTAAFNLNLLARINRELGGSIDLATFRHEALYNSSEGRIEMHLVSWVAQDIRVAGRHFRLEAGDSIHTENSYKYAIEQFRDGARAAGWHATRVWTDKEQQFSVHELVAMPKAPD
ncbi:L-histidine N(alpha)-methyltransferase [Hyphomicrobium sp. CS1GBMeth3]|uniref:L-histidine N(alpha)-methyltransferase n=1 Tax=Hyphomicrobium sp. CS1GBMeth3 TaxID=1892845 RepID=UPI00093072E4|nr:L-histidine N(alpha)-methyltransferase [Hyphomicrobium sp. CS1GBMeth3]